MSEKGTEPTSQACSAAAAPLPAGSPPRPQCWPHQAPAGLSPRVPSPLDPSRLHHRQGLGETGPRAAPSCPPPSAQGLRRAVQSGAAWGRGCQGPPGSGEARPCLGAAHPGTHLPRRSRCSGRAGTGCPCTPSRCPAPRTQSRPAARARSGGRTGCGRRAGAGTAYAAGATSSSATCWARVGRGRSCPSRRHPRGWATPASPC